MATLVLAVAYTGTGNRVMISKNGITWTAKNTTGFDEGWISVVFSDRLNKFVASAYTTTSAGRGFLNGQFGE